MINICVNVGQGTIIILGAQLEVYVRTMRARFNLDRDGPEHANRAGPSLG